MARVKELEATTPNIAPSSRILSYSREHADRVDDIEEDDKDKKEDDSVAKGKNSDFSLNTSRDEEE